MKTSKNGNFEFTKIHVNDILQWTSKRDGEQKIGEVIANNGNENGKYLILGICEDLGPQANLGNPGAALAYSSFLPKFLSIQANSFFSGEDVFLPGFINPTNKTDQNFNKIPNIINELDDFVIEILNHFKASDCTPIIIGGGHNNAYPILNYFSKTLNQSLAVVNCDAHADFRETTYRHSGNPFSFAFEEKLISKYAMIGLHQSYNNQFILDKIKEHQFFHSFIEDYLNVEHSKLNDYKKVLSYFEEQVFGVELDMDAIEYMPSSATSPSGFTLNEARAYLSFFAKEKNVLYLHLPEAAPKNTDEEFYVGKSLAYLVSDFIKNNQRN